MLPLFWLLVVLLGDGVGEWAIWIGKDKMTYSAYLDIGFGYIKALDSNGRTFLSPSLYSEIPLISLNGNETGIESTFGNFLFGDSASNISSMARRFQSYEDCLTDAYAASCLLAISELNGGNVVDVILTLSLPYQSMRASLDYELMKRLVGHHEIKRLGYHKQTINITFPQRWGIMPQNVSPAFVSLAPNGRFKTDAQGLIWIGIINVGSKTLELGTFGIDVDALKLYSSGQQMTFAKGVYTLADSVRPMLLDDFVSKRTSFTQHEIFNILRTGRVQFGGLELATSAGVEAVKKHYLQTVHNHCLENWTANRGKEPGQIYQFCVSGGGAHIVAPYLQDIGFHNNIVVSQQPQFDVVYGARNWHKLLRDD